MSSASPVERARWALCAAEPLRIARFEGEALVFNPVSWQTHLLNASALQVLDALARGPGSLQDLVAALGDPSPDDSETAGTEFTVQALVAELEVLGLVRALPVPACD